eukprot:2268534-Rhodomonas_salina.1
MPSTDTPHAAPSVTREGAGRLHPLVLRAGCDGMRGRGVEMRMRNGIEGRKGWDVARVGVITGIQGNEARYGWGHKWDSGCSPARLSWQVALPVSYPPTPMLRQVR